MLPFTTATRHLVRRLPTIVILCSQLLAIALVPMSVGAQSTELASAPQEGSQVNPTVFLPLIGGTVDAAIQAPTVPSVPVSNAASEERPELVGLLHAGIPGTAQLIDADGVVYDIEDNGAHLLRYNQQMVVLQGAWTDQTTAPRFLAESAFPHESDVGSNGHLETDVIPSLAEESVLVARAEAEQIGQNRAAGGGVRAAAVGYLEGEWGPVQNWPVIPIFVSLMSDGRVLAYDSVGDNPTESYSVHNFSRATVWDPQDNSFTSVNVDTGYNLFCSGFSSMADGRVFIAGGNANAALDGINKTHTFTPLNNDWTQTQNMSYARWYPSVTALPNGEMLITGGGPAISEVRQNNGQIRQLNNGAQNYWANRDYPWLQTAPDGRVAFFGPNNQLGYVSTGGSGGWQSTVKRDNIYRSYGSYAMYDIGKVLVAGGGYQSGSHNQRSALVVNLDNDSVSSTSLMANRRRQHNLTVLADGSVLATGGLSSNAGLVDLNNPVYAAELWNPSTGQWTTMASEDRARQYHSTALLLPDGRVFSGGGGICGACQASGYIQKNGQIFSPPYLFNTNGSGQLAARPTYSDAPANPAYNQVMSVSSPQADQISKVAFVRLSSTTHSQNMEQRYVPLSFTSQGGTLQITPPANANIAPPGHYMLFIVNNNGVPSVADILQLGNNLPPTISSPGNQSSQQGQSINLALTASDPNGDALSYTASGLPSGLAINGSSIVGTPSSAGTFNVIVTATDGNGGSDSASFSWTVNQAPPTNQDPVLTNPGNQTTTVGDSVNLALNASDPDGDALTFSASGLPSGLAISGSTISGSPSVAGAFNVTLSVSDGNGGSDSASFSWTVNQAPPTNQDPVLTNPGNQTDTVGDSVTLALNANDPDGDSLTFSASGLPNGLAINGGNISGTPTTAGSFTVNLSVSDGNGGSDSASFVWTVEEQPVTGVPIPIYQDSLASGWSTGNWSSINANLNHSTIVAAGSKSIALTYQSSYSTFFFLSDSAREASAFNALRFQVYGTSASQQFRVAIMNSAYQTSQAVTITPTPNQWDEITIPFNQFGQLDDILYLLISNPFNQTQPVFYLDEVVFLGDGSGPTNQDPVLTNPGSQSGQVGQSVNLTLSASDPDGDSLTYSASGLPTGLSLNGSTISGSPSAAGTFNVSVSVSDGNGGSDSGSFTWTVTTAPPTNQDPVLTNPGNQTDTIGDSVSLPISASDPDGDSLTFSASGLPSGLSLNGSTISGSPTAAGNFNVNVSVNDGNGGSDGASFTWTVEEQPITGVPIPIYQDSLASGWSTGNWSPVNVNLNHSSIVATGNKSISLAYQGGYSTFFFLSNNALDASNYDALRFQVYGTNSSQQFRVAIMNSAYQTSQAVTITPTPNQWNEVTIPFSQFGSLNDILYILISNPFNQTQPVFYLDEIVFLGEEGTGPTNQPPALTNPGNQSSQVGQNTNLTLSASDPDGDSLTFSASGLPNGLSLNGNTISGSPSAIGTFNVNVSASDGNGGSDSTSFTWSVTDAPPTNQDPVLNNPGNQNSQVGQSVNLTLSASDPDGDSLTYSASGLPSGLALSGNTIGGSPTTVGTSNVSVSVSDGNGGSSTVSFTWTVTNAPPTNQDPVLTNPGNQTNTVGDSVNLALSASDPDGDSLTFTTSGLPTGLSLNGSTISGSPSAAGTSNVTVSVNDGNGGSDTVSFAWTVSNVVAGVADPLYLDAVASGWSTGNWYPVTYDLAHSAIVVNGSQSIAVTYDDAYSTLFFLADSALSASDYQALRFQVYGSAGGQSFRIAIMNSAYQTSQAVTITPTPNQWTEVTLPFGQFGSLDDILYVLISNPVNQAQPIFYLDDIVLIEN